MINYREEEKRILDEILGKGVYDNRIRPSGTNGTGMKNLPCKVVGNDPPLIAKYVTRYH